MNYEAVKVSDPGFFIANMMRDCPPRTVIRELLVNAIENAPDGRIEWFKAEWVGIPKLGLFNEGPGMDFEELNERMNIANSGKMLGFRSNFGQGAKMSGGKASPYGLVYRSCKNGNVCQIWLRVIDEGGGKLLVKVPQWDSDEEAYVTVCDVTDDAVGKGRSLDRDWTEAILLGHSSEENTLTGAFLGYTSKLWLMQAINQRFYSFPPGAVIRKATITTDRSEGEHRNARGLAAVMLDSGVTERAETVSGIQSFAGSISIVYGKLVGHSRSRKGGFLHAEGMPSGGTHICLVYENEVYDLDMKWYHRAGAYGFSGASEDYFVHLLIPTSDRIENDNHRTEIRIDNRSRTITCESLADLVRDWRPQWVIDDIRSRQEQKSDGRVQERLRRIADRLKAKADTPVVLPEGDEPGAIEIGDRGPGPGPGPGPDPRPYVPRPNGELSVRGKGRPQPRPRPETLMAEFKQEETNTNWYEDLTGRAGDYDKAVNMIWLSYQFCEYQRLKALIGQEWPSSDENAIACGILDDEYRVFAGSYGIAALSFRKDPDWSPDQWEKALTPESISCHMRDPGEFMQGQIRSKIGKALNTGIREMAVNPD